MPLKSANKRLEIPMTQEEYEALVAHAGIDGIASTVRDILAKAVPAFASAKKIQQRGKYKRTPEKDRR